MSAVRVLRIIGRMNVGGPALQVAGLAKGLDPSTFEQRLLVGSVEPHEADWLALRAPDLEAIRVPGLGRSPKPVGDVRAFGRVLAEIGRFRPHIVHTHTAKAGALGRIAARLRGVPAIMHTFHGHLLLGYFSPRATQAVIVIERRLARVTTRLVAVGERVRDELLAAGIGRPDQYAVVRPGVQLPPVPDRDAARRALDLPLDAPVVAYVARLTRVKRPDRFAAMARRVAARRPDAMFLIAGDGELLAETQDRLKPLRSRVLFLGWRLDVACVYAAADVVVLTSDNEGFPVALIEAAMAGCPAVTTDVGSAAEAVAHGVTGLVCQTDPAELAAATLLLLDDPDLRRRLGHEARLRARRAFSRERMVEDAARLYHEVLATTR